MHRAERPVRVATLTVSDTRTEHDDEGGRRLRELLAEAGFELAAHAIVRDEPSLVQGAIERACATDGVDAVVSTGGTGIAARDQTYEAVDALLDKRLDGFGEAFRRLSWDAIGPRAILSRAVAGTARGTVVVALPGSPAAVELAVTQILAGMLGHACALARGQTAHAPKG